MESQIVLSKKYILNNYLRLLYLNLSNRNKIKPSIRTAIQIRLTNKRSLLRFYKKIIRLDFFDRILNSYIVFSYCLLKKYIFTNLSWVLNIGLNLPNMAFFTYHFLSLYRAIFLIKMILDWFPIRNWDRASPLKRFLRRSTIDWTKQFEKYFPSIFAWLIVINIIPIFLSLLEGFYISNDFTNFPTNYNFEEVVEFVLESKLHTFGQKLI